MTFKIRNDQMTETSVHNFTTEASDLRLPVGKWPTVIDTDVGNGLAFVMLRNDDTKAEYLQANGCCKLVIYND
jgi:hypothetical protein